MIKSDPLQVMVTLDQSYRATGMALFLGGKIVSWGVIKPSTKLSRAAKRAALMKQLAVLAFLPDLLVIEELWEKPGVSLSTGIIDYAYQIGIPIRALNPRSWKHALLGSGNARKEDAITRASQATGVPITDDNIADAICIGLCAFNHPELLKNPE